MSVTLSDIADIRLGHPFRGSIKAVDDGDVHVVQVRDTDESGEINASDLVITKLTGRKKPDWLQAGDILFVAKGAKHYAAIVDDGALPGQSVCSPHFFLVRIKPKKHAVALPAFIAWQLNQIPAQRYFFNSAEGSLYVSIRKQVLEDTPLVLPSIERQRQLISMQLCALNERKTLQRLIENRQQQINAIAKNELEPSRATGRD
ncbi:restriction endonuclease subunit S [Aestuariibacter sp. GS-14]|uniref:restriction endonuclease subunit S n=1 Tax=Aestuariibacter sp. GS-14 TaxID=2590670 RepID=UPI001128268F|nr:restriction endonuclease subunit S [Aestuariibacter sp. GS-14]TPV62017.1 restriction endonuclease subunit S [Aestuariibacter sp. GS-14]